MWGFDHCPHQLLRVVGYPTTNWKRGNTRAAVRAPSLSLPILVTDATATQLQPRQKPQCQPSPASPPPILFPSLPSAAQNKAASQAFGHRFDWEHLVTPRTCPGSLGQQDPLIKAPRVCDHQGRNEACRDCSRAKKPGPGPSVSRASAHVCVGRGG